MIKIMYLITRIVSIPLWLWSSFLTLFGYSADIKINYHMEEE